MNRNQRRYGRNTPRYNSSETKLKTSNKDGEIEEVFAANKKWPQQKSEKSTANRCCYVIPDQKDFAQLTESETHTDQYQNLLLDQYGFDPVLPDTIKQLRELKKVLCGADNIVENNSQFASSVRKKKVMPTHEDTLDDLQWQNIDNADDIDQYIKDDKEKVESDASIPQKVHISEIPRIKIIAETFTKLKKNNVELRTLDEKLVCIEYDIYKGNNTAKPKQKMRAYFSVKPIQKGSNENGEEAVTPLEVFANLKEKFNIADEDIDQLNDKEIEIIDDKIEDNKPYLEDLRRVLKRNQDSYNKKNKTSLDLLSLYDMAKKDKMAYEDFSKTNFLSKAELEEVKDLILKKCTSSVYGISRRKLKPNTGIEVLLDERTHDKIISENAKLLVEGNV